MKKWAMIAGETYEEIKPGKPFDGFPHGIPKSWFDDLPNKLAQIGQTLDVRELIDVLPELSEFQKYGEQIVKYTKASVIRSYAIIDMSNEDIAAELGIAKTRKMHQLSSACGEQIISGFESDVLGTIHRYKSTLEDQFNLSGLLTVGGNHPVECSVDDGITYNYVLHTEEQIRNLFSRGEQLKTALLQRCRDLKNQVTAIVQKAEKSGYSNNIKSEIDAIIW